MQAIEGNRAVTHIAPLQCKTPADAAAAAAAVRERRRSLFFVAQATRIAEAPLPVKAVEPVVVPPPTPILGLFAMLGALEAVKIEMAKRLTLDDIIRATCAVMGVARAEMLSGRRGNKIVVPRHIAAALCKALTTRSLPEIGRALGRDHTSVLYAIQKMSPVIAEIEDALHVAPLPYLVAIAASAYDRIKPPAPVRTH